MAEEKKHALKLVEAVKKLSYPFCRESFKSNI